MKASDSTKNDDSPLSALCQKLLARRQLIIASHRGPIDYHVTEDGEIQARRGSGGVVTALIPLNRYTELIWIASVMGEGDRRMLAEAQDKHIKSHLPGQHIYIRFVNSSRRTYHKYYNVFCNPLLWFLQHYMWNSPYTPNVDNNVYDAWETGYVPMNKAFADAVISEAKESPKPPLIMLHDYHLYLVARYIRQEIPDATLQHFIHIPWPTPSYWQLLPRAMREAICQGLCANDVVGLQTNRDVINFLQTCDAFLEEAEVDYNQRIVTNNGQRVKVNAYPVSIDVAGLQRTASSPRVLEYERRLRSHCGEKTIVRVDRTEPSKNITRGFKAFDMLLNNHPELVGRIKFLAFLVPSRTHIRQYQRYAEEITEQVHTINEKYRSGEWEPIKVFMENNYAQAIAGMRLYDVLLVNSVIDGMNLVAKEGPVVNTRNGVLVLSESAGAYRQLRQGALPVAPADLRETMQALYTGLTMSEEEKKERQATLVRAIEEQDIADWLYQQLNDLDCIK